MATEKKKPPYLLFVLLPVLAIGIVAVLRDRGARKSAEEANETVDSASQEQQRKSPEDVQQLLGRAPDEPMQEVGGRMIERYSWRGALQSYFIVVVYNQGDPPILNGVYLNEEP